MIHIKKFLDRISLQESKKTKDVVMPIAEARGLRDEICKILSDFHEMKEDKNKKDEIIRVEITGGKFK